MLWQQLKSGKMNGLDFDRQKIIGNYIVDFYCAKRHVVIEVDGASHNDKIEYDAERDCYLESLGLTVIHILAEDVLNQLEYVAEILQHHPSLACDR